MNLIAIDPGNEQSAVVYLRDGFPKQAEKIPNAEVREFLRGFMVGTPVAIEMIASYGMAVGREVFETCLWIGRFVETCCTNGQPHLLVYRREVKLFLCESARATDSNIRAALIDRYGPGKLKAVGTKKAPGPLYGLKGDTWSALAVALTAANLIRTASAATPQKEAVNDGRNGIDPNPGPSGGHAAPHAVASGD